MPGWKIVFVVFVSSIAAPVLLAMLGVVDRDLLLVVFVPSVLVGLVTGGYVGHRPRRRQAWLVDRQRMP